MVWLVRARSIEHLTSQGSCQYAGIRLEPSPSTFCLKAFVSLQAWTFVLAWRGGTMPQVGGERRRAWALFRLLQHQGLAPGRGRQMLVHCLHPHLTLHVRGQRRVVEGTPHVLRLHALAVRGPQPAVGQTLGLPARLPLFVHLCSPYTPAAQTLVTGAQV